MEKQQASVASTKDALLPAEILCDCLGQSLPQFILSAEEPFSRQYSLPKTPKSTVRPMS